METTTLFHLYLFMRTYIIQQTHPTKRTDIPRHVTPCHPSHKNGLKDRQRTARGGAKRNPGSSNPIPKGVL